MDEEAIWAAIEASNTAWTSGHPEEAGGLFHERAVVVAPGLAGVIEGRQGVVTSYEEFTRAASVHAFEYEDRDIRIFGDTAVATYRFRIAFEMQGRRSDERGQEILVFKKTPDGWQAVWRTQMTLLD